MKLKIGLVDDHSIILAGVSRLLIECEYEIVFTESNFRDAQKAIEINHSMLDLLIVDISLPDKMGLGLIDVMHQLNPETKIIVMSMHNAEPYINQAINQGAMGYISKQYAGEELIAAIESVCKGKRFLGKNALINLKENNSPTNNMSLDKLSLRELEIFKLLAIGHSPKHIGFTLGLHHKTVLTHRANIMKKLSIRENIELLKLALLCNELSIEDILAQ